MLKHDLIHPYQRDIINYFNASEADKNVCFARQKEQICSFCKCVSQNSFVQ
jgi:hypothetical protein